ncbi:MAG: hypothetical protein ACPGU0_02625, partial [Marinirhabdus sp.]
MKNIYILALCSFTAYFTFTGAFAQSTEDFEGLTVGATTFTNAGLTFNTAPAGFDIFQFVGAGAGGSDRFLDNTGNTGTNTTYTLTLTGGAAQYTQQSIDVYLSSSIDGITPTNDGTLTIVGK